MRDILITAIVVGLLPFIFRNTRVGAYTWAWLSMMNPHRAAFGFARSFPFAYLVAFSTLVSFLFSRQRRPFPINNITVTQLLFIFWMSVTCFFAINAPGVVFERWVFMAKIQLMLLVTLMLLRGRDQIERLIWVVTLSIGVYGIKGGVWTVLTGGGGRVWGPSGSMIEENNGLALALVMLVPFFYYLYQTSVKRWIRWGLISSIVAIVFAILGSQSRGALLAVVAMALVLAVKGKHFFKTSLFIGVLLVSAISFMPESWTSRMATIQNYEQDNSAMSRLYVWKTMWNLALDRPLVGGGFGTDTPRVFARYAPSAVGDYEGGSILVAHSIYFQALGEHGFPGLVLFLLIGIFTWRKAAHLAKQTATDPEFRDWVPQLMRMVQVSIAGFSVGGAFLSLAYFDLPYYIVGYVVLVDATVRERQKEKLPAQPSAVPTARAPS